MSYSVLGINTGHNGSTALIIDGKIEFYIEEERLSRMKRDGNPFRGMIYALQNYHIDEIVIGGTSDNYDKLPWTGENSYAALARKFNPKIKITSAGSTHHLGHAASAFYNSGFDEAVSLVIDGSGSFINLNKEIGGFETESMWQCSYPDDIKQIYLSLGNSNAPSVKFTNDETEIILNDRVTITKLYEAVSDFLGFGFIEAGKTMGLAPYGKYNENLDDIMVGDRANRNYIRGHYPAGAFVDMIEKYGDIGCGLIAGENADKSWHKDESKLKYWYKDLAWTVQEKTQKAVGDLIELAIDKTGTNHIVISGGYGLNCMANYYYKQRFPDLNLYVEPISHDGGTAIGLAQYAYYKHTKDTNKNKLDTLYLGIDRKHEIENYDFSNFIINDVEISDISKLLSEGNIVSVFQGRCEAGPRALGNRSILFDPSTKNGKDFVNNVKGREWFRPFAGTILEENVNEWFDLRGMETSPFMMYAVKVNPEYECLIPSIVHIDGSCRIQTVNENQNFYYYNLIKEFKKSSNIPVLFNTSFNLAGEPLVETVADVIHTLENSMIEYCWFPEIKKVIYMGNSQ